MKIATWNVNSLKVRLPHLAQWCGDVQPDILALQETKVEDAKFPLDEVMALGYQSVYSGQKTYNGVALLSRSAAQDVITDLPGLADPQRRVLAATVGTLRVVNLYVVNGQAVGSEKFAYKLDWLEKLRDFLAEQLRQFPRLVVLGDFNIAPEDLDVHDPEAWFEQVLCSTPERTALSRIAALGLSDSFRLFEPAGGHYTWWDYRQGAFRRNMGLRIDLILLSAQLRACASGAGIERAARTWERPSDHAPVWVELDCTP